MQANDGGLEAVMAGRGDEFTADATDADAFEITLGLFKLDFFDSVKSLQGTTAEDVLGSLVTSQEKPTVSGADKET
jgi:hypothetical protein